MRACYPLGSRSLPAGGSTLIHKGFHARVSLLMIGPLGKVKYTVTCYYAKSLRLKKVCCPSRVRFVRSLAVVRSGSSGRGKEQCHFLQNLDDRFITKQLQTELESFTKFAPAFLSIYLSQSVRGSPTYLCKI